MRKQRLYAPFIKIGKRWKWATYTITNEGVQYERLYSAYRKETAIRVYQNWLLQSALGETNEHRELRPLTPKQRDMWNVEWNKRFSERKIQNDQLGDGRMRRFTESKPDEKPDALSVESDDMWYALSFAAYNANIAYYFTLDRKFGRISFTRVSNAIAAKDGFEDVSIIVKGR